MKLCKNELKMFDSKKYFLQARKEFIETPLKELGFKKYKSAFVARLTTDNVFQFIDFQKSAYGGEEFTVNIAIRPLFCPNNEYLTLLPGNRLSTVAANKNDWWNYSTLATGQESFRQLYQLLSEHALPFFDATKSSDAIVKAYEKNIFGRNKFGNKIAWGTAGWENFDFGHIYLKSNNHKKAIQQFEKCYNYFKDDKNEVCSNVAKECLKIIEIIHSDKNNIEAYLNNTISKSKDNLQLQLW